MKEYFIIWDIQDKMLILEKAYYLIVISVFYMAKWPQEMKNKSILFPAKENYVSKLKIYFSFMIFYFH
jgi:hypothetical protein